MKFKETSIIFSELRKRKQILRHGGNTENIIQFEITARSRENRGPKRGNMYI